MFLYLVLFKMPPLLTRTDALQRMSRRSLYSTHWEYFLLLSSILCNSIWNVHHYISLVATFSVMGNYPRMYMQLVPKKVSLILKHLLWWTEQAGREVKQTFPGPSKPGSGRFPKSGGSRTDGEHEKSQSGTILTLTV